jgi:hypothetical protein
MDIAVILVILCPAQAQRPALQSIITIIIYTLDLNQTLRPQQEDNHRQDKVA